MSVGNSLIKKTKDEHKEAVVEECMVEQCLEGLEDTRRKLKEAQSTIKQLEKQLACCHDEVDEWEVEEDEEGRLNWRTAVGVVTDGWKRKYQEIETVL